jgi:hypothetical protein
MTAYRRNLILCLLLSWSTIACSNELTGEKDAVLKRDARNEVVDFTLTSKDDGLVFCLNKLSGNASAMDVFRVFLHSAEELKDRKFKNVELCFRNETKFILGGDDFTLMGKEFETQNPLYTIRTFPEKLALPDGKAAYETHRGGVLYLMQAQMADFQDMNGKWFLNELAAEEKAKTDALRPTEFATENDAL